MGTNEEGVRGDEIMIVFDLDMVLADCRHRMHFIDSSNLGTKEDYEKWIAPFLESKKCPEWAPDYKSFYDACDKDELIKPIIEIFKLISMQYDMVEIWSGRCESAREKTIDWLLKATKAGLDEKDYFNNIIKMRPIGDDSPVEVLKERWLDEYMKWPELNKIQTDYKRNDLPEMIFDSHPESIAMFRKRGIFVFDCNQEK